MLIKPTSAFMLLIVMSLASISSADDDDVRSVKDLLDKVQAIERASQVTEVPHFKGRLFVAELNGPLTATLMVIEGSVTYDGVPGGRFVASFEHNVTARGDSREDWIDETGGQSFDGSEGRSVQGRLSFITTAQGRALQHPGRAIPPGSRRPLHERQPSLERIGSAATWATSSTATRLRGIPLRGWLRRCSPCFKSDDIVRSCRSRRPDSFHSDIAAKWTRCSRWEGVLAGLREKCYRARCGPRRLRGPGAVPYRHACYRATGRNWKQI